jgi:hypothetical protein
VVRHPNNRRELALNDLVVIRDADIAVKFETHFGQMWTMGLPMVEFAPAIEALEPR